MPPPRCYLRPAPLTTTTTEQDSSTSASWRARVMERFTKVSNIARLLCVIDCTELPIITLGLPLFGLAASPAQSQWLHELGHKVALYFVMPVGGLASTMNYLNHRQLKLSSLSFLGLSLIYAANAGHHAPLISLLPRHLAHQLHCGSVFLHRTTNTLGCALLLSSNYFSYRTTCTHADHKHGPKCNHDHDHSSHNHEN
jgi:hypothetical protein